MIKAYVSIGAILATYSVIAVTMYSVVVELANNLN